MLFLSMQVEKVFSRSCAPDVGPACFDRVSLFIRISVYAHANFIAGIELGLSEESKWISLGGHLSLHIMGFGAGDHFASWPL